MAREAPRWADQSSDENVRTRWSALQTNLQGVNRATRTMEIGTTEQDEHSGPIAAGPRDIKRGRTSAQEFRPGSNGRHEGGQAGTQN